MHVEVFEAMGDDSNTLNCQQCDFQNKQYRNLKNA